MSEAIMAQDLTHLADIAYVTGDVDDARAWFAESLAIHRSSGTTTLVIRCLGYLGRYQEASDDMRAARDIAIAAKYPRWAAVTTGYLGTVALDRGNFERARADLEIAIAQLDALGDTWAASSLLVDLGRVFLLSGDSAGAEAAWNRSVALVDGKGDPFNAIEVMCGRALLARARGDLAEAETLHAQAAARLASYGAGPRARITRRVAEAAGATTGRS